MSDADIFANLTEVDRPGCYKQACCYRSAKLTSDLMPDVVMTGQQDLLRKAQERFVLSGSQRSVFHQSMEHQNVTELS